VPQHLSTASELVSIFHALSDPTRLAVVERLSVSPASASELARPFAMALPSFMQHMGVLERARIVTSHKTGRVRTYQLAPSALQLASGWMAEFRNHWERKLDQLDHLLITTATTNNQSPHRPQGAP
jgi:DNA-binding transcriptional ArsR family regulator